MPTRYRIPLAILLIILPVLVRFFTFYQGIYSSPAIQRPDYSSYQVPEPPTPSASLAPVALVESGKVVIVDAFHGNQYDPSEIEPLVTAISARGGRVEYDKGTQPLATQLKYASAYLVLSPSIVFSGEELRAVRQFVESGGRLLVFADPTRSLTTYDLFSGAPVALPDVNYSNPLIAPFGLTFVSDYLYNLQDNEGNFRNVKFVDFADNPLTAGLKMVVFYGVHSIRTNTGTPLTYSDKQTLSSATDQGGSFAPLALSANGQVLAVGDFSFLTNPFNQVADNALLLGSITDFALNGERAPSLVNFPYLFRGPVSLVTVGDVQLEASLFGPVATLQNALRLVNVPLNMRAKVPASGNVIILGTFLGAQELMPYARSFGISVSEKEKVLEIKGLGKLDPVNSGLLLFSKTPTSKTLILVAPTKSMLPQLIKLVASGDLSSCVVQENLGVCSLEAPDSAPGDTSSDDLGEPGTPNPTETPPAMEATPTPAG